MLTINRRRWRAVALLVVLGALRLPVAAEAADDPVLMGAGDIGDCTTTRDTATGDIIRAHPEATVFTAGDNAYDSGTAAEFANCYAPVWGSFKDRTRPALGNH